MSINEGSDELIPGAERVARVLDQAEALPSAETKELGLNFKLAGYDRNDFGNGQRLRDRFEDVLLHVGDVGWLAWTGQYWCKEQGEVAAQKRADETRQAIYDEASALEEYVRLTRDSKYSNTDIADHRRWAVKSGDIHRRKAMLASAQTYLSKKASALDQHPYLFNCQNGTLDLGNPENIHLKPHDPEDLITRISSVTYDSEANCPRFLAFLDQIAPDKEVQLFLQQWAGYSLTGNTSEQKLVLFWGSGANGKSTYHDILRVVYGDYAQTIQFSSLLRDDRRRGSDASPDLARLRGIRAVFASEPEHSAKFSEGLIKSLTGGEPVLARHLHKEFFEFRPEFKISLAFNNKPHVQGTDGGIWRRLFLIAFTVTIPPDKRDARLPETLKTEAAGILNWMLDGYKKWREHGFMIPEAVREATRIYQQESDPIGVFFEEGVETGTSLEVQAAEFYAAYQQWGHANAVFVSSATTFGKRAAQVYKREKRIGVHYYVGVRPLPEWRSVKSTQDPDQEPDPPFEEPVS